MRTLLRLAFLIALPATALCGREDCNGNGQDDSLDLAVGAAQDCNGNGVPDSCDLASGAAADCNNNNLVDECEVFLPGVDCDGNGQVDFCEITQDPAKDCNGNMVLDLCESMAGAIDCNGNGIVDSCELAGSPLLDCNQNAVIDSCEGLAPASDFNGDGYDDACVSINFCQGNVNSSGQRGHLSFSGSPLLQHGTLTLVAGGLPSGEWSFFVASTRQSVALPLPGSQGLLCLGEPLTKLNLGSQQVALTANGQRLFTLDPLNPAPLLGLAVGETLHFQLWYRDSAWSSSGTSDGATVLFR